MDTKGVASVRSPVCNLRHFDTSINHDTFVEAVVKAFREEYDIYEEVQKVEETEQTAGIEYIRNGMEELPVSYYSIFIMTAH